MISVCRVTLLIGLISLEEIYGFVLYIWNGRKTVAYNYLSAYGMKEMNEYVTN